MAQDAHNSEDHACEIAVCVSDEDFRWIPIVEPERDRDADEWEEHVQGEQMRVRCWMWVRDEKIEAIVDDEQDSDDDGLRDFDAVDAGQDIDAIGTEYCYCCHVDVVEEA
jgi:hypothetical protein